MQFSSEPLIANKMTTAVPTYLKHLIILTGLILLLSSPALAQSTGRIVVDPNDPRYIKFTKLVGEVTQIENPQGVGNGFIIGRNGCHIFTNFHVAFGKGKDPRTKEIEIVENAVIGHKVRFAFDLDSKTGKFKHNTIATVVEFGNYETDTKTGLLGDLAILRLDNCFGKEFAGPELDQQSSAKSVPSGKLITVSTSKKMSDHRQSEILVEEGCRAYSQTPIGGVMVSNCDTPPGTSGSMVLEQGLDHRWRLIGISTSNRTLKDGTVVSFAIYSPVLKKFIDGVLGEESINTSPVTEVRKP